jgi:hypothetical protein
MRAVIVACVMLAGCGEAPYGHTAQQQERYREANANTPAGRADILCRSRTQFAMAGWQSRRVLDIEGAARGGQLYETCMDTWRRTGQIP